MPKLASSKKRLRQARRAQMRNKSVRTHLRTTLKKMRSATTREQGATLLPEVVSVIDRTARKGILHPKAAARQKSRLAHFVAALP